MRWQAATCPLDCADACGALVASDAEGRFLELRGNPEHPYSRGTLCGKTAIFGDLVNGGARLLEPLVRERGRLVPASWETAVQRVAERVGALPGERLLAAHYAGSMGLVARRFPLRMMHALGATETDGGLCDNTATAGWQAVLGRVVGADIEEAGEADLALLWGADVARTVQHLQPALRRVAARGAPVVAIDVYRTDTIERIERWGGRGFIVRPGSDAALALGLARLAFERGAADRAFLEREASGAAEFEAHVRAGHDLAWTAEATGLGADRIEELFALLVRCERPFWKTGVGFTRRRNGAMSMRAVLSLAAVLGVAERVHYESFESFELDYRAIERPDLRAPEQARAPIVHVALGRELASGRYGALFVWGHNPAVTCPDAALVRAGLEDPNVFVVVHDPFLTETAERADVVLPATLFVEHEDVYRSYGHRYVQWTRQACKPPGEARSNVAAFGALARALGLPPETWDTSEGALCRELVAASAAAFSADELAALEAGRPVKVRPRIARRGAGRDWGTPSGRIELASSLAALAGEPALATYVPDDGAGDAREPYQLLSCPSVHTHNSTYLSSARHLRRAGAPRVCAHPDDARREGWTEGQPLTLVNARARLTLPLALSTDAPPGILRIDGFVRAADVPEGHGVNALVSPATSDLGAGNVLYSTRVRVESAPPGAG